MHHAQAGRLVPVVVTKAGGALTTERDSGRTSWVLFFGLFQEKHLGS